MSISKPFTVFGPDQGGPSENYRIPSMVVTKSGVVVACADARYFTGQDNPNRIDKVIRRSTDSGETWQEYILAVEEHGESKETSSAAIDPCMVYVEEINRIYMLYCSTPSGVGILNCECSTGEDEEGNLIVLGRNGKDKYILKNGCLYKNSGEKAEYAVDEKGNVSKNGEFICNIHIGGEFKIVNTAWLMLCYSDDEGLTWSKPVSLNLGIKKSFMSFIGPGPGVGIVIKQGKYKGRIVCPIYYGTHKKLLTLSCTCIYSDDMGKTWHMGKSPNTTRKIGIFKANHMWTFEPFMLTESQLIEQKDGVLKYFMRNHSSKRSVAVAYSYNGGESWENFHHDESLPQCICQMSVIALENMDKPYVVFLNPASRKARENGVVRLSEDGGETFKYSRQIKDGPFVYSTLAQLPDGTIGAMYEPDLECRKIDFVKFTLDWIKDEE